jgi:outer membrane lipoprotein SlyB
MLKSWGGKMQNFTKILIQTLSILMITTLSLTGCASEISPDSYSDSHVGETSTTYMGTIVSVRHVKVGASDKAEGSGAGVATGALAGGAIGSNIGGGRGNGTALVAGALLGAFAGAAAEKKLKNQQGIEYVIKLETGELKTVVQGPQSPLMSGQRVLLMVSTQGRSRVVPYHGE